MIILSESPYSINSFYEGSYTSEDKKVHHFTFIEMLMKNPDDSDYDITWVDTTPDNSEEAERQIVEKFYNRTSEARD